MTAMVAMRVPSWGHLESLVVKSDVLLSTLDPTSYVPLPAMQHVQVDL